MSDNGPSGEDDEEDTVDDLTLKNSKMIDTLIQYKNNIDTTFSDGTWDKYKKYTNDYELVFTSMDMHKSISKYVPISRSFFKMWEILHYFEKSFSNEQSRCFFMAEGPGGFVEAFSKWRGDRLRNDDIFVTTLVNADDKSVPSLRIPKWASKGSKQFGILYGPKKNGDICDIENMNGIIEEVGLNSCHIVTGDGGFDFSANFNDQEYMSTVLVVCEVLLALQIQKENGTFVLKMYDISLHSSFQIITLLQKSYKSVQIIKPRTSRPANSEKYLVCTGYSTQTGMSYVPILTAYLSDTQNNIIIDVPIGVLRAIIEFNSRFVMNQIMYIVKTMHYIENKDVIKMDDVIKSQIKKGTKWCKKYNIPHHSFFLE